MFFLDIIDVLLLKGSFQYHVSILFQPCGLADSPMYQVPGEFIPTLEPYMMRALLSSI